MYPSGSNMGASTEFDFCDKDDLKKYKLYGEYLTVYELKKCLTEDEKREAGIKFSKDKV